MTIYRLRPERFDVGPGSKPSDKLLVLIDR